MKLSHLKLSLISLFLWESQVLAQTQALESSSVGMNSQAIPKPTAFEDPLEVDLDPYQPEPIKNATAQAAGGYRQAQDEVGQGFIQGSALFIDQNERSISDRRLNWDLGMSSDYSGLIGTSIREDKKFGAHRFNLELGYNGRAFKGDGAGLEEIYQAANRLARDFSQYQSPETTRADAAVRLGDTIRLGTQSSLAVSGEFRQDHYQIKDALDDGSVYEAAAVRWQLGLGRESSLDSSFRRSVIIYRDHRNDFDQSQDLNEAEVQYLQPISTDYIGGIGYRSLDGEKNGPLVSVTRKPDVRLQAQGRLSYLIDGDESQTLASLRSQYLWTRNLRMTLNLEQGIDLLASYGSLTTNNQTRDRQQRLNRAYEMDWAYVTRYSTYSLVLISNRQDYADSQFSQQEGRIQIDYRVNTLDRLISALAFRGVSEKGQVANPIDRRYGSVSGDWRHYWGLDSKLFGAKSFMQIGLRFERLWEGEGELERRSLTLALGQEWL
jgi:hypothetical protein